MVCNVGWSTVLKLIAPNRQTKVSYALLPEADSGLCCVIWAGLQHLQLIAAHLVHALGCTRDRACDQWVLLRHSRQQT